MLLKILYLMPCSLFPENYSALRKVIRTGFIVFGLSALFLLVLPALFLDLLGLSDSAEMVLAMRVIGITLLA